MTAPEVQVTIGNCILVRFPSFPAMSNDAHSIDAIGACYIELLVCSGLDRFRFVVEL